MTNSCPACGSADIRTAFTVPDHLIRAAAGEFSYSRCVSCESVFADPQPDDDTLARAYAPSYGNYNSERGLIERMAEPILRREARRVVRAGASELPVLEVGCGTGFFLERLAAAGWRGPITGVEYAPDVAAATADRTGFDVTGGTAEEARLNDGYGAIVLRHVIEHVRDPHVVLARLAAALDSRGVLYIATPDTTAWAARVFGRRWVGYDPPRHLVVFSSSALRGSVARAGLEVIGEHWGFSPDMWNGSLYLALDRGRGLGWTRQATALGNPIVSGTMAVAAAAEVTLGHSTMYSLIARRPASNDAG